MDDEPSAVENAVRVFSQRGGILRTGEAIDLGIHPTTLYAMRDAGEIEQLSRGLFRLASLPPLASPDLVTVALKVPQAVVCLVSALSIHDLTTQIPRAVDVALQQGAARPRLDHPPLNVYWFSGDAWQEGIETHRFDDVPVRVYGPAKSVADIFKYRRKIGLDVALEALKRYRERGDFSAGRLMHYAHVCRVETVMTPYVEALV
jgi:predicted transcriptional regulator of viral defense system